MRQVAGRRRRDDDADRARLGDCEQSREQRVLGTGEAEIDHVDRARDREVERLGQAVAVAACRRVDVAVAPACQEFAAPYGVQSAWMIVPALFGFPVRLPVAGSGAYRPVSVLPVIEKRPSVTP